MSAAELDGIPRAGEVVAGRYRVEGILGEGGMGVVLAARQLELDRPVALKVMWPDTLDDREAVERFLREARAAARLRSEHVIDVLDAGRLDGGAPFIAMELLEGRDLDAELAERGPLPVAEAVDYVLQASRALAEAHEHGMVHRDLKPANLFRTTRPDGSPLVKVLDFGISFLPGPREGSRGASRLTATGSLLGTVHYMSPEQAMSPRSVDGRSDIWALGVILYELCTGALPFDGDSLPDLVGKIMKQEPARPRSHRPDLPEHVERAVMACLAKDREARPRTIAELAALLAESPHPNPPPRAGEGALSRTATSTSTSTPTATSTATATATPTATATSAPAATSIPYADSVAFAPTLVGRAVAAPGRGGRGVWVVSGGLGIVAVGLALFVWWPRSASPAKDPAPAASTAIVPLPRSAPRPAPVPFEIPRPDPTRAPGPSGSHELGSLTDAVSRLGPILASLRETYPALLAEGLIQRLWITAGRVELTVLARGSIRTITHRGNSTEQGASANPFAVTMQFFPLAKIAPSVAWSVLVDATSRNKLGALVAVQLEWFERKECVPAAFYWTALASDPAGDSATFVYTPTGGYLGTCQFLQSKGDWQFGP